MGTLTTKLKLFKPGNTDIVDNVADLNNNFDTIDINIGSIICTSTTRPTGGSLFAGLGIYETDTGFEYIYDGSTWQPAAFATGSLQRLATVDEGSDSAAISTVETQVGSIVAAVVSGKKYQISLNIKIAQSVGGDTFVWNLKQDTSGGTSVDAWANVAGTTSGTMFTPRISFTAAATANKTFVLTLVRISGTGTCVRSAKSSYTVDRIW